MKFTTPGKNCQMGLESQGRTHGTMNSQLTGASSSECWLLMSTQMMCWCCWQWGRFWLWGRSQCWQRRCSRLQWGLSSRCRRSGLEGRCMLFGSRRCWCPRAGWWLWAGWRVESNLSLWMRGGRVCWGRSLFEWVFDLEEGSKGWTVWNWIGFRFGCWVGWVSRDQVGFRMVLQDFHLQTHIHLNMCSCFELLKLWAFLGIHHTEQHWESTKELWNKCKVWSVKWIAPKE